MSTGFAERESEPKGSPQGYWPFVFSGVIGAAIPLIVLGLAKLF